MNLLAFIGVAILLLLPTITIVISVFALICLAVRPEVFRQTVKITDQSCPSYKDIDTSSVEEVLIEYEKTGTNDEKTTLDLFEEQIDMVGNVTDKLHRMRYALREMKSVREDIKASIERIQALSDRNVFSSDTIAA